MLDLNNSRSQLTLRRGFCFALIMVSFIPGRFTGANESAQAAGQNDSATTKSDRGTTYTISKRALEDLTRQAWTETYYGSVLSHPDNDNATTESERATTYTISKRALEDLTKQAWTEIYYESVFSHHDRENVINDLWLKHGVHLFQVNENNVDLYLKARLHYDRNGDFWNNDGEYGVGIRYKPFDKYGLYLFSELMRGRYLERSDGDYENPYDESYYDWQAGFTFWQRWGKDFWQIEREGSYSQLTSWREVYADGIYHHRDDGNFIGTVDYKEGILLGRLWGIEYDAYLGLEASADTNNDFWNNYYRIGPGIRLKPFKNQDLKVSFEYFHGKYYRGNPEPDNGDYGGFTVALGFWIGL